MSNILPDAQAYWRQVLADFNRQIAELRNIIRNQDEQNIRAAERVGIPPTGADTVDWLAEEALELRAERDAALAKLNQLSLATGLTNGSTPLEQYRLAAVATAKRNMELEALLRQHHEAQSALGVDSESGTDLGEAYTYSDLCDRTMAALGLQAQPESEESCPGQQ